MKRALFAAIGLLCVTSASDARAQEIGCATFPNGDILCDDGIQMFYRLAGSEQFSVLSATQRQRVLAFVESVADEDDVAAPSGAGGRTDYFGRDQSITTSGNCVSASLPGGGSFMGSGC
jgi:hypothetical protein